MRSAKWSQQSLSVCVFSFVTPHHTERHLVSWVVSMRRHSSARGWRTRWTWPLSGILWMISVILPAIILVHFPPMWTSVISIIISVSFSVIAIGTLIIIMWVIRHISVTMILSYLDTNTRATLVKETCYTMHGIAMLLIIWGPGMVTANENNEPCLTKPTCLMTSTVVFTQQHPLHTREPKITPCLL